MQSWKNSRKTWHNLNCNYPHAYNWEHTWGKSLFYKANTFLHLSYPSSPPSSIIVGGPGLISDSWQHDLDPHQAKKNKCYVSKLPRAFVFRCAFDSVKFKVWIFFACLIFFPFFINMLVKIYKKIYDRYNETLCSVLYHVHPKIKFHISKLSPTQIWHLCCSGGGGGGDIKKKKRIQVSSSKLSRALRHSIYFFSLTMITWKSVGACFSKVGQTVSTLFSMVVDNDLNFNILTSNMGYLILPCQG